MPLRSAGRRLASILAIPIAVVCNFHAPAASAQAVDPNLWGTDGVVKSVVRVGDKIYIGGSFTQVGPCTGGGVPLDVSTGGFPGSFPHVDGTLNAVASDGSGGWYIGGLFTTVGGYARNNLAHIASDMSVTTWDPGADNVVRALVVSGSKVIIGGDFMNAGGQARTFLAAIDANTGAATMWDPQCGNVVYALALNGSTVFVGGGFGNIGSAMRQYAAEVDLSTGIATAWNPSAGSSVYTIAVGASLVYLGGAFSVVGGQARNCLAAVDFGTGGLTGWNPNPNNQVNSIAVIGSTVYVGGFFSTIGGASRNRIAALNATGAGTATSWNAGLTGNFVWGLCATPTLVYIGGAFSSVNGTTRYNLAAIDATTGTPTSWDPHSDISVLALALSGSTLYAGGNFGLMHAKARRNLAQLDANTGVATAWDPSPNGTVNAIVVSSDSVYVGGLFNTAGGQTRNNIARLDGVTGAATTWNPSASNEVLCLALGPGVVYAGGSFGGVGGGGPRAAALSTATGAATAWQPSPSGPVYAITPSGSTVYLGGNFSTIAGTTRNRIGAVSSSGTGALTSWNPNADNIVRAIAVSGSTVYVGGDFGNIGGASRPSLAAIDAATGTATSWSPAPNGGVGALAVDGTRLYAAGSFNILPGAAFGLACYAIASGALTSWNPNGNNAASCLSVYGNRIYAGGYFTTLQGQPHARLASIQAAPEIYAASPTSGGSNGPVTITITGRNLVSGASVSLQRPPPPSLIAATNVTVAPDGASLTAILDLTGLPTGTWDVVVTNPDQQSATLPSAFSVNSLQTPQLQVALLNPEPIRASYPTSFDLVVENPGNVDAIGVPVWIYGIPVSATFVLDFTVSPPPLTGGEPDWSQSPITFGNAGGQVVAFVIPRVPPGSTVRRFTLNVPASVTQFQLGAGVSPTWSGDATFLGCLAPAGLSNTSCAATYLGTIRSYLTTNPQLDAVGSIGIWAKEAWECEGATTLGQANGKGVLVAGYMEAWVESGTPPSGCGDALLPVWRATRTVHVVTSIDPNDKLAPVGTISSTQAIPYSIRFENLSSATAAARQVTVVDPIPTSLDLNTLSLESVDLFGTVHLLPPPGSKQFTHDVDLGHDNLIVRVSASLDTPNRLLTWVFSTLDKTTLQPPTNQLYGFLPPNVTPPQGEGSVLFTIRTAASTPNGATIQNGATLNFDGSAQNTPVVSNLLDNNAPASNVLSLGTPISTNSFPVSWQATGSPSDLRDFTIYVAEDGQAYQAWKANTVSTSDTYVPRPGGHSYAFYSVARDLNGNIEAAPPVPDTQTQSTTAVGDDVPRALALAGARPNPAHGVLHVAFTLPSPERATLDLIDIAGRRVARREVGAMGPGNHELSFDTPRSAGLYFIRLIQAGQVLTARVVLMR